MPYVEAAPPLRMKLNANLEIFQHFAKLCTHIVPFKRHACRRESTFSAHILDKSTFPHRLWFYSLQCFCKLAKCPKASWFCALSFAECCVNVFLHPISPIIFGIMEDRRYLCRLKRSPNAGQTRINNENTGFQNHQDCGCRHL